ncbi:MBL fold metallo-hydrolase RNA specificity domain-containing protein [Marimonas lutisalis]|uniref:MBL fold metallo-hydrolase RNA specificity domain-containing protein n=1 Tax=Marimonas lutisalis TaxID=2545756 RepID=UPI0010F5225C|nr:MBL fold metallo-hydrolase [Marimonas lutisalis]
MQLSFHGAAHGVTGSCHLVSAAGRKILVDCGMFQGGRELYEDNAEPFGFDPGAVDFILLTHAHLDHCGRIPLLVRRGFEGEIISTAATRDLTRLVLMDSAHLHEEEARHRRKHGKRAEALYDTVDALDAIDMFGRTSQYGKPIELCQGVTATFFDAGHILGSASILLEVTENGQSKSILFSGDIGPGDRPLLNPPAPPEGADYVVMETTYGDRHHRSLDASVEEFYDALKDAEARGGNVVIPTFALERAQELLYFLHQGMENKTIRSSLQVYLDSPMAISATKIFERHPEAMKPELAQMLRCHKDPFDLPGLHFTQDASESRALNRVRSGALLMAGSGMCTGGRVRHHLRHNLAHSDCSVVFVGYAAEGTLARIIIDGAKSVKLFGDHIPIRAKIHTINGFSAHAGRKELLEWHSRTGKPKTTFLVHGEEKSMQNIAKTLKGHHVQMPKIHQSFEL